MLWKPLNKRVLQNNSKDDFFSKIKRGIKKWRRECEFQLSWFHAQKQIYYPHLPWTLALYSTSSPEPRNQQNGEKMGKSSFHGEKVGKSVVCLSANLRTGNQTIIPTDLETSKYSTKQQNFNLNGEYLGMFSALKAPENNRTHTTVLLNHLHCSLLRYDICRIDKVYCSWITGTF